MPFDYLYFQINKYLSLPMACMTLGQVPYGVRVNVRAKQ